MHIVTSINLGGAENHLFSLINEQLKHSHQVTVVYLKGDGHWALEYKKRGVKVICLEISHYIFLYRSFKLKKICDEFIPDIIHAHMPPAELVMIINKIFFSIIRKIPQVITKHNDEPFAPIVGNHFFLNLSLKFSRGVIFISQAIRKYHEKIKLPFEVIYYGINKEEMRKISSVDLSISTNQFVIGTVARLTEQKSLPTLLQAFKLFLEKYPDSTLVIVGVGELELELKKLAKKLNIFEKTIWAGKRADVYGIMKRFDIFALPSIYEGLGLVILEALAQKVPVIASRVSAIPEVLDNGNFGLLFEAENYQELYDKFIQVKEGRFKIDFNKCDEMLDAKFSLEKMYLKTQAFYCNAISFRATSVS